MTKQTPIPKLVMGSIEVIGSDGEPGIPYDQAVIHFEGDEDSEIEISCPAALRLVPIFVTAVNSHSELLDLVKLFEKSVQYEIRKSESDGDKEGANLKSFTLHMIREAIAKASAPPPDR